RGDPAGLLRPGAVHRDEGGAEALHAGKILVAACLVDAALASELGHHGLHRHAVGLDPAVSAALAYQFVDDHAPVRIGIGAALAPPPLLGRAGLVVDENGNALDLAQLSLHRVQLTPVVHRGALGKAHSAPIFFGFIRNDSDALHALRPHLLGDAIDGE